MSDKHIVSSFDRDLEGIQASVIRMGGEVEAALSQAAKALQTADIDLAEKIRRGDAVIDEMEVTIKTDAALLLARRSPTASDLRTVLTVMEIASHLERCGDYAKNISKRTIAISGQSPIDGALVSLRRMSSFVERMISDALDCYIQRDAEKAREIIVRDTEVDEIYNTLFRSLLTHMMEDHRNIAMGMHLHFIAKNIERIGDHATGIAEQCLYLVTGEFPDEDRPKKDKTSTVFDEGPV
ncbi:phosphate signaling complex protein PhoU [Loktanella sp. SALINAS62]|uniref:phosphate signaling complex protein PhoU n=1 Tax=Loktanella sp. SALINAS62 TaxID=2706124 RepID=UPI0020115AD4|nr:phosphate signaling complex protein PhoU [Loktanella sp. SALINAS62]